MLQQLFQEQDRCIFCHAGHKELCTDIQGRGMPCSDSAQTISTCDIIKKSLKQWSKFLIPGDRTQNNRPDTVIPFSTERLDMAAYTFTHHMEYSCALEKRSILGEYKCF
jgi:hypothetical protein